MLIHLHPVPPLLGQSSVSTFTCSVQICLEHFPGQPKLEDHLGKLGPQRAFRVFLPKSLAGTKV